MKKRKRIIITSISIMLLFMVYYNYDYKYQPNYVIINENKNSKIFAKYSKGNVYIINDLGEINNIMVEENDIVILDQRNGSDPNMKIIGSSKINDKNIRNEIIEIIQEYERLYPSNWDRTTESMRLEWFVHNFLYNFNYKINRTEDVDFNNNDENEYKKIFINNLIKI